MTERKGFKIRLSDLFPEGISVLKPINEEIDREHKAENQSRARVERRISELPDSQPPAPKQSTRK